MSTNPEARTRFTDETDEDLLAYVSMQADDPSNAEEAWDSRNIILREQAMQLGRFGALTFLFPVDSSFA